MATAAPPAVPACPKKMVYGPCGGVRLDGGCEMVAMPRVFGPVTATDPVPWAGPVGEPAVVRAPLVLTDLSVPPADAATLSATARALAPSCDALLVGTSRTGRTSRPPCWPGC